MSEEDGRGRNEDGHYPNDPILSGQLRNGVNLNNEYWCYAEDFEVLWKRIDFEQSETLMNRNQSGMVHCRFIALKKQMDEHLSSGSQMIKSNPNAGGSSKVSESMAFSVLEASFKAKFLKTEKDIEYFPKGGPRLDFLCKIFNKVCGVSVTRAYTFSRRNVEKELGSLLSKKLADLPKACANSLDRCDLQLLVVWTPEDHTNTVAQEFNALPNSVKGNTIVMLVTAPQFQFLSKNSWTISEH